MKRVLLIITLGNREKPWSLTYALYGPGTLRGDRGCRPYSSRLAGRGAPHFYDHKDHIWIDGREFAEWVASQRKPKRDRRLKDHEAYCMRCNQVVEMVNPTVQVVRGNLLVHKGKCPNCQCTINRGGRRPNPLINQTDQQGLAE